MHKDLTVKVLAGQSERSPRLLSFGFASYTEYSRRLGGSVTVTRQSLDLFIGVRIPASQPKSSSRFISIAYNTT